MRWRGISSQNQLARISGVPQSTIHRILARGDAYAPTRATLERLARALHTTVPWLSDGMLGTSAALCHELGIKHRFTRPYRPQTNSKAERFIQSALREWAYAHTYQNSQHRADAMKSWLHHYNWHRPHQGIGRAVPISRLNLAEYNLLTVHS
ncbi:transposase [Bordetella pertussis]|nr:transposase [Bordetella pertussis]